MTDTKKTDEKTKVEEPVPAPVDEVVINEQAPELEGAHYYDGAEGVRVPEVVVHEENQSQIVSVTVDETVDPDGPLAFQVPRESLGSMGLPLHTLALGSPQQQLDALDKE
jgi:hypothetical protein